MAWDTYQRVGGALAVIGSALWVGATVHRMNAEADSTLPGDVAKASAASATTPAPRVPTNPNSLKVNDGDLLVIKGPSGLAVVALKHAGTCRGTYEWRYRMQNGQETSGNGEVYEKYAYKPSDSGTNVGVDIGGKLLVMAGPYEVAWSCGGETFGWVYGRPGEADVYLLPTTSLAAFRF
jgi:hypothetical protein